MATYGLRFEFFDAVDGNADPFRYFSDIDWWRFRLNSRRAPLPGEIGCYASHLALWRKCVALNRPIVILEDDFQLATAFPDVIRRIQPMMDTFGFIRLESLRKRQRRLKRLRPASRKVFHLGGFFNVHYLSSPPLCALAYAINPEAALSLIEASVTLAAPVDKFLQQTWVHRTPLYGVSPAVVTTSQHASLSMIGDRSRKSRNPALSVARLLHKSLGELRRIRFDKKQLSRLCSASAQVGHVGVVD